MTGVPSFVHSSSQKLLCITSHAKLVCLCNDLQLAECTGILVQGAQAPAWEVSGDEERPGQWCRGQQEQKQLSQRSRNFWLKCSWIF